MILIKTVDTLLYCYIVIIVLSFIWLMILVDANFQRQCIEAHNVVREKYGAGPLAWSQELADLAKSWAHNLADRGRVMYPELPGKTTIKGYDLVNYYRYKRKYPLGQS